MMDAPLVKGSSAVFEHVDELCCCGTDPVETVANDLGTFRLPHSEVERWPAGVQPTVAPDDVRDGFGLNFAFRPLGVVVDVETWEELEQPLADGIFTSTEFRDRRDVITRWEENLEDRRLIKHALALYSDAEAAREQMTDYSSFWQR